MISIQRAACVIRRSSDPNLAYTEFVRIGPDGEVQIGPRLTNYRYNEAKEVIKPIVRLFGQHLYSVAQSLDTNQAMRHLEVIRFKLPN